MERLNRLTDFQIELDMETFLYSAGCAPKSPSRPKAQRLFPSLEKAFYFSVRPCAWSLYLEEDSLPLMCICLLSLGNITDQQIGRTPTGKESCLWGFLFDAYLQEYLFQMDRRSLERLRADLAAQGLYIQKRLEAPRDFGWEGQKWLLDTVNSLDDTGISLSEDHIFSPPRTMAYLLLLGDSSNGCTGEHDCSCCRAPFCSRKG